MVVASQVLWGAGRSSSLSHLPDARGATFPLMLAYPAVPLLAAHTGPGKAHHRHNLSCTAFGQEREGEDNPKPGFGQHAVYWLALKYRTKRYPYCYPSAGDSQLTVLEVTQVFVLPGDGQGTRTTDRPTDYQGRK
jgi:hypothetical protein